MITVLLWVLRLFTYAVLFAVTKYCWNDYMPGKFGLPLMMYRDLIVLQGIYMLLKLAWAYDGITSEFKKQYRHWDEEMYPFAAGVTILVMTGLIMLVFWLVRASY